MLNFYLDEVDIGNLSGGLIILSIPEVVDLDFDELCLDLYRKTSSDIFIHTSKYNILNKELQNKRISGFFLDYSDFDLCESRLLNKRLEEEYEDIDLKKLTPFKDILLSIFNGNKGNEDLRIKEFNKQTHATVVGGSISSNRILNRTQAFYNGEYTSESDWIFTILMSPKKNIEIIKEQSFSSTGKIIVPTKTEGRNVFEFDCSNALDKYLDVTGLTMQDIDNKKFFNYPLSVIINGDKFLKVPISVNRNTGSMYFGAIMDKGEIHEVEETCDFLEDTEVRLKEVLKSFEDPFVIHFLCINRINSLRGSNRIKELEKRILSLGTQVGFSTYGEALDYRLNNSSAIVVLEK